MHCFFYTYIKTPKVTNTHGAIRILNALNKKKNRKRVIFKRRRAHVTLARPTRNHQTGEG